MPIRADLVVSLGVRDVVMVTSRHARRHTAHAEGVLVVSDCGLQ